MKKLDIKAEKGNIIGCCFNLCVGSGNENIITKIIDKKTIGNVFELNIKMYLNDENKDYLASIMSVIFNVINLEDERKTFRKQFLMAQNNEK